MRSCSNRKLSKLRRLKRKRRRNKSLLLRRVKKRRKRWMRMHLLMSNLRLALKRREKPGKLTVKMKLEPRRQGRRPKKPRKQCRKWLRRFKLNCKNMLIRSEKRLMITSSKSKESTNRLKILNNPRRTRL